MPPSKPIEHISEYTGNAQHISKINLAIYMDIIMVNATTASIKVIFFLHSHK